MTCNVHLPFNYDNNTCQGKKIPIRNFNKSSTNTNTNIKFMANQRGILLSFMYDVGNI